MIREFNYNIGTESAGKTIEEFLRRLGYSHHVIVGLKRTENGICLNGLWAYTNQRMKEHDILSVHLEESESSPGIIPAPVAFEIVYEDEDLMVIDKPADTPIHPSQGNYDNTLANGVAYYFAQQNIPYVYRCINRLDRDTTGLLILAKHGISGAALSAQMMERRIHRTYHALAEGHTPSEGTIDAPIARKEGSTIERCVDFTHGETAITHYHTLSHESSKTGFCIPAWNFIWRQAEPIRSGSICTVSDIRFWATHYTARKIPSGWNIRHFTPTLWNSCILSPEKKLYFSKQEPW